MLMMQFCSDPSRGKFVWLEGLEPGRNQFVRFTHWVEFAGGPGGDFWLHLFADTRYRLRVNGAFVAAGPGRFVTQFPEFDSHNLSGHLVAGSNRIEVEVNFFGASSYQTMPDGKPGFIAWGGDPEHDLATPGAWSAEICRAWREDAPLFSFAQNPVEICDTRREQETEPRALRVLEKAQAPWGPLSAYSGRPITYGTLFPSRIKVVGKLANSERLFGFMAHNPDSTVAEGDAKKPWTAFATWILSPCEQTVRLSCFWADMACNGAEIPVDTETPYGNHGYCEASLREGWNLLTGKVQILTEYWAWCLGIPESACISLHARRDANCADVFAIAPASAKDALRLPDAGAERAPQDWTEDTGDPARLTPARVMGWDRIASGALCNLPATCLPEVAAFDAQAATWCFAFEGEYLGYLDIEVEGPAGTVVDAGYDDWDNPAGGIALYRSNPFTDTADRYFLRGGVQRIEGFHPRGGKFLQITLRSPDGLPARLGVHRAAFRSRQTFAKDLTRFSCDMPVLEWAWPVAFRTLIVSTDESYSDCPWRERGAYIGDAYVCIHLNALLDADLRTARRVLRIFARSRLPDGQLACCAPSWLRKPHEDFTLIWVLALRDHWAFRGDLELARELWPTVVEILKGESFVCGADGLWSAQGRRMFIDWGVLLEEREGAGNAALNLFRFGALLAAAELAGALGMEKESTAYSAEAIHVQNAVLGSLWRGETGTLRAAEGLDTPALHANVLALRFRLGDHALRVRILRAIETRLCGNFRDGITRGQHGGHLELYFLHYLLPALAEHGRPDLAERIIEDHYGYLRTIGDDTLPECFCRVENGNGSRCHSWSGAAAIYAARYVLGLQPARPGRMDRFICRPVVQGITSASGRIAHPDGWIEVEWEKSGDGFHLRSSVPAGVEVDLAARGQLPVATGSVLFS